MKNFNYNNYIGKHMDEPLRVKPNKFKNTEPVLSYGVIGDDFRIECSCGVYTNNEIKPLIKSPSDLTDDELKYIFGVDFKVNRKEHLVYLRECRINLKTGYMQPCNQQILNRFYSLHASLDYDELIRTGKAVRKE